MSDEKSTYKVFIGGLNLSTTKESLKDHFEQYGEIVDAVVMKDPGTKRSRGFGFVTYTDSKSIDDCLSQAHVVDGREVEAKRAIPREESSHSAQPTTKKVFLGGLSLDTAEEDIREVLEPMGKVEEVTIMREKESDRPRGFGFAVFESADVVDMLCTKRYIKIKERDVEVKKAISQDEMRRGESSPRTRGGYNSSRDHAPSYGARDPYQYSRGAMHGSIGGYDYRFGAGAGDYMRPEAYAYPSYLGAYPDRTSAAYYASSYGGRGSYDMQAAAVAYGGMYSGAMGGGPYGQSPSSYGPSRSTGYAAMSGTDYGKDRGTSRTYHPYRRTQ